MELVLPQTLTLRWVSPAWSEEGVVLSFEHATRDGDEWRYSQQLLLLNSAEADPARAADDMADQLLSTFPEDWVRNFGYDVR
jgi:hypothetical protein